MGDLVHIPGRHIRIGDKKLWCEIEGEGEDLLLIAGGPGAAHTYLHPLAPLKDSCRLIFFDAFGCGRSSRARKKSQYTFAGSLEDIESLRQALGIRKWNVLGHSYGGMVAAGYALAFPSSIRRLVLANAVFSGEMFQSNCDNCNHQLRNQYPEVWKRILSLRSRGHISSSPEHQKAYGKVQTGLFYFYDASNAKKTVFELNNDLYFQLVGADADFKVDGELATIDFSPKLKKLSMPTLSLAGRFDRVCMPRFTLEIPRLAPQIKSVMFENSGHLPFLEEPDRMFKVLRNFLSEGTNRGKAR